MVPEYYDLLKDSSNISVAATNVAYDNVYNLYTLNYESNKQALHFTLRKVQSEISTSLM